MHAPAPCLHCGSPVPEGVVPARFCCAGCESVYGLLQEQGLTRYYALAGGQGAPALEVPTQRSRAWLEPLLARAEADGAGSLCALQLDVQGLHCAACVWLMEELFRRQGGGASLTVNPALGTLRLRWAQGRFDVGAYLTSVERFGYLFGPPRKRPGAASRDLPVRLGVCAALTMNVMMFSVAFYLGLSPAEGDLFALFTRLSVLLSTAVVLVGGWPFLRTAVQGVRRGVLHLDLPIAVGILLVYATSLLKVRDGRGDLAYFDTLNTFVTLMLVGRWLQQRVIERNRRFLLEDDGADGLVVRREEGAALATVRAPQVREGDVMVVAPGDLVPVDAELLEEAARFSTDWITGESAARQLSQGERVPAGAFNGSGSAVRVRALSDFADSPLVALLRQAPEGSGGVPLHARFWNALSRGWAVAVLGIAAAGLALWWPSGPQRALEVAVALLVVTCPCALGLAVPLAYELAQARLRRIGLFSRRADLLDRLPRVRSVLFDKTGTLTLGRLELVDPRCVEALSHEARDAAFDMVSRSNHPVSRCLAAALSRVGARYSAGARVVEVAGCGLEMGAWRLGKRGWCTAHIPHPDPLPGGEGTVLTFNGQVVAVFSLREAVRADARREVAALQSEGLGVWLISGDAPERVGAMALALGVPAEHALGGQRPEDKAAAVRRIDRQDTLYLGDGVNDSLAFEAALCAGTPAIDRPVMPGKADFFLLGEGLAPLREALALSRKLRAVVRRTLALALAYNVLAIATCLAGLMTPLRAAVAMPLSSLSLLLLTAYSLAPERARPTPSLAQGLQEARA
ncbi:heavy metal translocating P-type ATPase [Aggregicoccus sp. 17bor-14]|uniref:heavy metal translocating P-type ATPase n=1 Tax=Myxococcaceae TaxID=31 RepID=UPI00129CE300|nr:MULTISPECIES: heavy metal translocating P-type ATPase metal-binding domain-containing protein [Myxococcaceae]MBF5045690.1 heavy metal translocating P-type ATPase [Simulacricoccus sp. 17bor-14]MRI91427.1 heavy metal translocating P-type ATPase [Aggregicoccus sp. 17bor-14]